MLCFDLQIKIGDFDSCVYKKYLLRQLNISKRSSLSNSCRYVPMCYEEIFIFMLKTLNFVFFSRVNFDNIFVFERLKNIDTEF